MTAFWNVPYIGQVGSGANEHGNDCGASSAAMVIQFCGVQPPTIDTLFNEANPNGDAYLSVGDLLGMLSRRGINADWDANITNVELFRILSTGVPVIALIRYGALETIRPNKFTGSHFVVVIGMDLDTVYIHDPLNTPTSGECVPVPVKLWDTAWSSVGDQNPQRSAIIPAKTLTSIPVTTTKTVYPRDKDGCNVRNAPNGHYVLYAIPYGQRMTVYEENNGWGRIHKSRQEWICLEYTK